MDTSTLFTLLFELVGGLGIFLIGMKYMSEGMQAIAGAGLRRMISAVTNNRLLATGVGVLVTCVVQSSSITTVMVVGFVNSGLMQLSQAIGVIMGANIGTTITGWILVLKVGKYGLPVLGFGAFGYLFSRQDRWRYLAMVFLGIGMIFFGLEVMKGACSVIKKAPEFEAWFKQFTADNYFGVLKCCLIGCVMTVMVQSSSATLGITISLASQGIITYETAAALVLGENLGTTITAYLASLGATTNAKRAAYFHVIFNLCGVAWITLIFGWYIELVQWIVPGEVTEVVMVDEQSTYPNVTPAIAATHTIFNIANMILFLPLVGPFVRLLNRIVPAKEFKEKPHLTDLEIRLLETPVVAIEQSRKEIEKMGIGCAKMLEWLADLRMQDDPDKSLADRLQHRERVLDSAQDEISVFVTGLLSGNIPHSVADEARRQLRMADEYESISDYIVQLDRFDKKLRRAGHRFTSNRREKLNTLNQMVAEYLDTVNTALTQKNPEIHKSTESTSKRIRAMIKKLRREHLDDLTTNNTIAPQISVAYMASLNAYANVREHTENIAESVSGER